MCSRASTCSSRTGLNRCGRNSMTMNTPGDSELGRNGGGIKSAVSVATSS